MFSLRTRCTPALVAALSAAAAVSLMAPAAHAGTYTSLAAFLANVRSDNLVEPFNGVDAVGIPPISVSGNGYAYTVSSTGAQQVNRFAAFGVGATFSLDANRVSFTGRPVSAFAGTFHIYTSGLVGAAGTLVVQTNTGESFNVAVPAAGAFFGFTTSTPFTTVTFDINNAGATFEGVDDLVVGVSATAPQASDQCSDASTITATTAAVYPFTTVGATAEAIPGVCDGATDTGPDVWFRYVAPLHGTVVFNTCGCTFDSILRVFASCAAAPLGANIACNDDFCTGGGVGLSRASQVTFRVVAGEDYLVRISGFNGASGSGNLNFSFVPDCAADFNHSGIKNVQDIFDFLASWFGAC